MRPKPLQLAVTTDEQTTQMGPSLKALLIKNIGSNTVYVDFDNPIVTAQSYPLEPGETLTMEWDFVRLHYKGAGTSTLNIIKIIQ